MTTALGDDVVRDPTEDRACTQTPLSARASRTRYELPALALLLIGAAVLYAMNLTINGFGNDYYAAAVQAGTQNWTALLFGSLDPQNFITVDKPPASLWVMALSGRIFGFSSWSMLLPNALIGVATVWLLYAAVRRVVGPGGALLAGATLALTPVAVLMFRFNDPDALLVLLVVAAGYCVVRATETAGTHWLLLAGVFLGFGFLTKMLQAFLVVPGLGLAYLVAGPTGRMLRRLVQLLAAGVAILVAAGWWLVVEWLWPTGFRPYVGGSTDNSSLQLALGYNGLSRIVGSGRGSDQAGPARLLSAAVGDQVTWLLPAALLLLLLGLWSTRHAGRTDPVRASLLLWGGWVVVCGVVFSFMQGTFHSYYTIQMAPGIAALVGIGGHVLWRRRKSFTERIALVTAVAITAEWTFALLGRSPSFLPWLGWSIVLLAVLAVVGLLVPKAGRRVSGAVAGVAIVAGLAAPAAYALQTTRTAHAGISVSAGPKGDVTSSTPSTAVLRLGVRIAGGPAGASAAAADPTLVTLLRAAGTRWSAAVTGAQGAAALELAGSGAVMGIGGFNRTDPVPSLQQFQAYVARGEVRYYLADPTRTGGQGVAGEISAWVRQNYRPVAVGGYNAYDLSPKAR